MTTKTTEQAAEEKQQDGCKEWVQPTWYGTPQYWAATKQRDKNLKPATSMGL